MHSQKDRLLRIIPVVLVILILSACTKTKAPSRPTEGVLATVNGEPIYLKDFKRELALKVKQDPTFKITPQTMQDVLELMVNRHLIIQEAMKKRLAEEDRFVNTIRIFWEQTLTRDFIDYKNKEFEAYIYVTEDEIKNYYERLKEESQVELPSLDEIYANLKTELKEQKLREALKGWLEQTKKKAKIKINMSLLSSQQNQ